MVVGRDAPELATMISPPPTTPRRPRFRQVGMCACGRVARRWVCGGVACDECLEIEARAHGSELARGVCGYVSRGILARSLNL